MTLGMLGGVAGLALALALMKLLVQLMPAEVPRLNAVGLDGRLLGFSFLISLLAGILFGLAPAVRASKIGLSGSLKESGRGRLRNILVVSEIALAAVLFPPAGLLIQSFLHLIQVNPGFDPQHVLTFQIRFASRTAGAGILPRCSGEYQRDSQRHFRERRCIAAIDGRQHRIQY